MQKSVTIKIKRVYEPPAPEDGTRILVDRLWPRGLTKEKAKVHRWAKELAPSTELRKWFNHDPEKWAEFQQRYRQELKENKVSLVQLQESLQNGTLTLVYGAKDEQHNDAVVLKAWLQEHKAF